MGRTVQISARISEETKRELDRFAEETGMKKERLIERAIVKELRALKELPADVIVHRDVVVSLDSLEQIARRIEYPQPPTKALRDLMAADAD